MGDKATPITTAKSQRTSELALGSGSSAQSKNPSDVVEDEELLDVLDVVPVTSNKATDQEEESSASPCAESDAASVPNIEYLAVEVEAKSEADRATWTATIEKVFRSKGKVLVRWGVDDRQARHNRGTSRVGSTETVPISNLRKEAVPISRCDEVSAGQAVHVFINDNWRDGAVVSIRKSPCCAKTKVDEDGVRPCACEFKVSIENAAGEQETIVTEDCTNTVCPAPIRLCQLEDLAPAKRDLPDLRAAKRRTASSKRSRVSGETARADRDCKRRVSYVISDSSECARSDEEDWGGQSESSEEESEPEFSSSGELDSDAPKSKARRKRNRPATVQRPKRGQRPRYEESASEESSSEPESPKPRAPPKRSRPAVAPKPDTPPPPTPPTPETADSDVEMVVPEAVKAEVATSKPKPKRGRPATKAKPQPQRESSDEGAEVDAVAPVKKKAAKPRARAPKETGRANGGKRTTRDEIENADPNQTTPVLSNPQDMFIDMIKQTPGIEQVVDKLGGRPLRVCTMCSGTESPLLALSMLSKACEEVYGKEIPLEHVFSCEIDAFKQAYIERNFAPPLLFRDICELAKGRATTAYGSIQDVPQCVDLAVAGTSCVDFSNLNTKKKTMADQGQSGKTFDGMIRFAELVKLPMIVLENVKGAPWKDQIVPRLKRAGYEAKYMFLDTKKFYIPQTRERGYCIAIRSGGKFEEWGRTLENWEDTMNRLQRPATVALEAFLLPPEDVRVQTARAAMRAKAADRSEKGRAAVSWAKCESRHQRVRVEEAIGTRRPVTGWEEGGGCKLPDFAWHEWGELNTERVLDCVDIQFLRLAKERKQDASYKTMVWELSQNADRMPLTKAGITPCLTPHMQTYLTHRGGPLVGAESLAFQVHGSLGSA